MITVFHRFTAVFPILILLFGLLLPIDAPAQTVDLIQNGGFETGNFTGWTAQTVGYAAVPWRVSGAGQTGGTGMVLTQPQEGLKVAWNGFDGGGPMRFILSQTVTIPDGHVAILSWMHRIQWNFLVGMPATLPRTFDVLVRDPVSGNVLAVLLTFETGTQTNRPTGNTGWVAKSFDLSAYAGQSIRIEFLEYIPQALTGYGQFEIDAVSLLSGPPPEPEPPTPTPLAIDIRPGGCPNPLNLTSRGLIPVAILGSPDLDVLSLDPDSIRLEGVAPWRVGEEDVAGPASSEGQGEGCAACEIVAPDGYRDLIVHFRTEDLAAALADKHGKEIQKRDCLTLTLTADRLEGGTLVGTDSMVLVRLQSQKQPPSAKPQPTGKVK